MAHWAEDETLHRFSTAGKKESSLVHVHGVMDHAWNGNGENRAKLILEDHPDSKGASVHEPQALDACIQSLSAELKIKPQEADWFVRGRNGNLQQVSYNDKKVAREDPQFTDLKQSGDLYTKDLEEAKKALPDIHAHSSLGPIKPEQQKGLNEAFQQAKENRGEKSAQVEQAQVNAKQETTTNQEKPSQGKSAHEYDLSQERIRSR